MSLSADNVHPRFRVWILVPVDCIASQQLSNLDSCVYFVLEKLAGKNEHDVSIIMSEKFHSINDLTCITLQAFLQDFEYAIRTPVNIDAHDQHWESYKPLISKLQQCIPTPLTHKELEGLNPFDEQEQSQSQLLLAHIYEELAGLNAALDTIHASLQQVASFTSGECMFSGEMQHLLIVLASGVLPEKWVHFLQSTATDVCSFPLPLQLMSFIKLLKARTYFYTSSLQRGYLPHSMSPLWFSNVKGLLSKLVHGFARECQMEGDETTLKCKVDGIK